MDTEGLGKLLVELGGGRARASDIVNPGVGLTFHKKLGASVQAGDPLVTVDAELGTDPDAIEARLAELIVLGGARKPVPKLFFGQY
jgi:thymidine phosphorylase